MKVFNYNVAPQVDSVVVLAGGPSTARNKKSIMRYISKYNSVVFAANYDYGIKADYTFFTDMRKLNEQKNLLKTDIILRLNGYIASKKKVNSIIRNVEKRHNVYFVGSKSGPSIYKSSRIEILPDGSFPYYTLGAAGYGCIVLGLICKPKRILFVGIDGPIAGTAKKEMFDGTIVVSDVHKDPKIIKFFKQSLFPSLRNMKVCVETFEDVRLYDLNKKELGVKIL